MPRNTRRWGRVRGWHNHGFACWDSEWKSYVEAAGLAGKSTNGWVREWLNEAVKYERLQRREDDSDLRDGFA